jgi:hypothetical protein
MSRNGVGVQFISFTVTKILFINNNDNGNKNKEMRQGGTFGPVSLQF